MSDEWLSTREVAERLGYRDLKWLRGRLLLLGIHSRRLGSGQWRWSREMVETIASGLMIRGNLRGEKGSNGGSGPVGA